VPGLDSIYQNPGTAVHHLSVGEMTNITRPGSLRRRTDHGWQHDEQSELSDRHRGDRGTGRSGGL